MHQAGLQCKDGLLLAEDRSQLIQDPRKNKLRFQNPRCNLIINQLKTRSPKNYTKITQRVPQSFRCRISGQKHLVLNPHKRSWKPTWSKVSITRNTAPMRLYRGLQIPKDLSMRKYNMYIKTRPVPPRTQQTERRHIPKHPLQCRQYQELPTVGVLRKCTIMQQGGCRRWRRNR